MEPVQKDTIFLDYDSLKRALIDVFRKTTMNVS